jgi:type I restriction enzyme S subunit
MLLVALPSLAEQVRIMFKVDELMTLCDKLKLQINHAQTTQLHIADAAVEKSLS